MKNEAFRVNSRKDIKKKEVEVWMRGKGGGGDCSTTIFNEKCHKPSLGFATKARASKVVGQARILRQNVIWMWPPWRDAKYTIRGKVVASPKSGPRLLVAVLAPKVLKLCTNQHVVRFVQIWMNE
jgi:hypothetical protein